MLKSYSEYQFYPQIFVEEQLLGGLSDLRKIIDTETVFETVN